MGRPVRIVSLARRPSQFATLFPAEIVSVTTADGAAVEVFVKHLGDQQSDHPSKQRRDRELRVYERLLSDPNLPVACCYGTKWDEAHGRGQLFLECIGDWNLKYHGLEFWFESARQLAHLHAHFAQRMDRLEEMDFLLHLDAQYFHEWAERAIHVLRRRSAQLATGLKSALNNYNCVTDLLDRHARTLVHNDLSPKNVIADRAHNPARICFVDWEMAGVGCGLLDLVQFKDGLDPASDQKMRDIYCHALAGTGMLPDQSAELARLFAACEVHMTLYRMARSPQWNLPDQTLEQWCERVRRLMERI